MFRSAVAKGANVFAAALSCEAPRPKEPMLVVTFEVWCAGPPLAVALSSELPWQKEQMPRFEV